MQSYDPAKMLTNSGKLQTLDLVLFPLRVVQGGKLLQVHVVLEKKIPLLVYFL